MQVNVGPCIAAQQISLFDLRVLLLRPALESLLSLLPVSVFSCLRQSLVDVSLSCCLLLLSFYTARSLYVSTLLPGHPDLIVLCGVHQFTFQIYPDLLRLIQIQLPKQVSFLFLFFHIFFCPFEHTQDNSNLSEIESNRKK